MAYKESALRVQGALREQGFANEVVELPDSTRTAAEAARAVGCDVAQIAKSLIFRLAVSGKPLLIVASGVNRVDENIMAQWIGEALGKADADFVRAHTGFAIGGVPPMGHHERIQTVIDEDLFRYDLIWAAAGHPKAVFRLTPAELKRMTDGIVMSIT
ncbi:MAG: YbaK/EbsC family protein [Bacilli bacterium]